MTIPLTPVTNVQQFGTWLQRTNDIVTVISTNTVTVDSTLGGSISTGNAFINGTIRTLSFSVGNSLTNTVFNPSSIDTTWGWEANTSGLFTNSVSANIVSVGASIINNAGAFVSSVAANYLNVASYFTANASSVNATAITVAGLANVGSVNALTQIMVGTTASLTPSLLTVGVATLNAISLSLGSGSVSSATLALKSSSGNVTFTGASLLTTWGVSGNSVGFYSNAYYGNNVFVGPATVNAGGVYSTNVYANSISLNAIAIGTTSVNSTAISANIAIINNFSSGQTSINSTGISVNSGVFVIGNSSINAIINSSSIFLGNTSSLFFVANSLGLYTNNNLTITGNFIVGGNLVTQGTTSGTGDYIPTSNSYNLGNNTNRWIIWASSLTVAGQCVFQANASVANTLTIGTATINNTIYTGTANNTSYVGTVPAINVVSNSQLWTALGQYTNTLNLNTTLGSYTTSTQLTNNLVNYQTIGGVNTNIAAFLPNYTGVINTSSISIGTSTVNVVANSTAIKFSNSTVNWTISLPTAAQVTNGQYNIDATGSWTQKSITSGSILTTGTTTQNIDSFSIASNYGAEYLIDVGDNNANNRYISKILLTHDGTNPYITEYASIVTNSAVGAFESTTNATVCTLNFTPVSTNTTIRWSRILI